MFVVEAPNMARKGDWARIFRFAKDATRFYPSTRTRLVSPVGNAPSGTINAELASFPLLRSNNSLLAKVDLCP